MKKQSIILFIVLLNSFVFGQNCFSDIDLIQQAQEENKSILLYFSGSDWCKPCMMLKENVLNTDAFQEVAKDKYIVSNYDFPQNLSNVSAEEMACREKMASIYNAQGVFPKLVLLDDKGNILKEINGYRKQSVAEILDLLSIE